jgi:predicted AAA+ superfamily ATPase
LTILFFELKTHLLFVLDEIHKISGWEEYVIDLSRNPNWKVIVTGSSSKLLKYDIATELRGKAVSSTLYPLSFSPSFLDLRISSMIINRQKGKLRRGGCLTFLGHKTGKSLRVE